MKNHSFFYFGSKFIALALLMQPSSNAATIAWPAVEMGLLEGRQYGIGTGISPSGDASILFEVVEESGGRSFLSTITMTAGIGHMWFAAQSGDAVDASAMVGADYLARSDTMEFGSIDMPLDQIFYLGFRLDATDPLPPDYTTPSYYIYGWASLLWNGTTLSLVDSAAETTGVGIYAGTYDAIPEPASAGLLLAGIAAALLRRRRPPRPQGGGA